MSAQKEEAEEAISAIPNSGVVRKVLTGGRGDEVRTRESTSRDNSSTVTGVCTIRDHNRLSFSAATKTPISLNPTIVTRGELTSCYEAREVRTSRNPREN